MSFLKSIDTGLFNFLNQSISNPVFDWLMPFLSGACDQSAAAVQ